MQEILLGHGGGNGVHSGPPVGSGSFAGRGDLVDGVRFWGEVSTNRFINGSDLASAIGLTAGSTIHNNNDAGWLHFELDGKTLYVAKRPFKFRLSWNSIHAQGAVYGTSTIETNGETYKVRLLTGADTDPTPAVAGYDPVGTSASEWNRLIYAVHNGVHTDARNTTPPGYWPLYSDADLVVSSGDGKRSWCQETNASNTSQRVVRGYNGVSHFDFVSASNVSSLPSWRPVLELVE